MIEARRRWLESANNLITDLRQRSVYVSKQFPGKEHLRPLNQLSKFWREKVGTFLARDPAQLVSLHKLEDLMKSGQKLEVDTEAFQFKQLSETLEHGRELRKQLREYSSEGRLSYTEAKYFHGQLFSLGIKFPESEIIRDIVSINGCLERQLSSPLNKDSLLKLQKYLQADKLDPELSEMVIRLCEDYEALDIQLDIVLSKVMVDFSDLNELEVVDNALRESQLQMPRAQQFADLFSAFSWTIKTCLEYNVKANSLDHAIVQLKRILDIRLAENPLDIVVTLEPLSQVSFTISPIKEFLDWAKILYWRGRVKKAFSDDNIDLSSIEELVATAPRGIEMYQEAYNEFSLVEGVLKKAKGWRKLSAQFMADLDGLFGLSAPREMLMKLDGLYASLNHLRTSYHKEDLKLIKNLSFSYEQLKQSEKILTACRNIGYILSGEPVHINDFLTTIEIIEKSFKDDRKYSMLMHQFQKIQKDIIPSLDELNKVSNALNTQSLTPKGMKIKEVVAAQANKVKVFDLDYHLEKLNTRLILGDLGNKVDKHLKTFFGWEKESKVLLQQNTIKGLLSFTTKEQIALLIKKSRDLRRSIQSSNLYSETLEDLIAYNWCLKVVDFLKLKELKVPEIKTLIEQHVVQKKYTKRLLELLNDQIANAKFIARFCEKMKESKPTEKEVEALKSILKGFRISLPNQISIIKEYFLKCDKIKERIDAFLGQPRPTIEMIETMAKALTKEPIIFEKSISKLNSIVEKCKNLIRLAKKDPSNPKLMKAYKNLNVSCPEFESLVREKKLDKGIIQEYEEILTSKYNDFSKIEEFELRLETINDIQWVDVAKKALIRKKIHLLKEAVEKRTVFSLDMHLLKNLGRDAFLVENKDGMQEELKFIEEFIEKAETRLKAMRNVSYEKLITLKKRMFGCVDISREIAEQKFKYNEGEKRREALRSKKKESQLRKRSPEKLKDEKVNEVNQKKKEKLIMIMNEEKGNKKILRKPREHETIPLRRNQEKDTFVNVPEFRNDTGIISDMMQEELKPLEEPINSTGVWAVFEGTIRFESENKNQTLPEVTLSCCEPFSRITQFSKLPIVPTIRDSLNEEQLTHILQAGDYFGENQDCLKILGGVVSSEGLSRITLSSVLNKPDAFYYIRYSSTTKLIFVPSERFQKKWFGLFENSAQVKDVDSDFYWFIISEEKTAEHRIEPTSLSALVKKEEGANTFDQTIEQCIRDRSNFEDDENNKGLRKNAKMSLLAPKAKNAGAKENAPNTVEGM